MINGSVATGGGDAIVPPGGTMLCEIPGGAGLGNPKDRSTELIERDIAYGYVSLAQAQKLYGYACQGAPTRPNATENA